MEIECAKVRVFDYAIFMLSYMYIYVEYVVILNMCNSKYVGPVAWCNLIYK